MLSFFYFSDSVASEIIKIRLPKNIETDANLRLESNLDFNAK
jgi:hypothetical protein